MNNQEILQKYVGDQHALESHILQAVDKQLKLAANDPEAKQELDQFVGTLNAHLSALEARLKGLGGSATHPVKEAGAAVLGAAAGLIDKVRAEEISKDLRDDYTALNLSVISYMMLNATALALGDHETATLAETQGADNAGFVMWINNHIARFVIKDLGDSGASIDPTAQKASETAAKRIWTADQKVTA